MTCKNCGKRIKEAQHPILGSSYIDSQGRARCQPKDPTDWLAAQLTPFHEPKKES